jgi:hypothetical protein
VNRNEGEWLIHNTKGKIFHARRSSSGGGRVVVEVDGRGEGGSETFSLFSACSGSGRLTTVDGYV